MTDTKPTGPPGLWRTIQDTVLPLSLHRPGTSAVIALLVTAAYRRLVKGRRRVAFNNIVTRSREAA